MEKEKIIEVLDEWNYWSRTPDSGISREPYLELFEKLKTTEQVIFITGVRRSGKTTLMRQYINNLIEKGNDRRNNLYINFEEPKFIDDLSVRFLIDAHEAFLEIIQPTIKPGIFLDEIQNIKGWERFVRALHEKGSADIFVSGSSAKLLSKELGTALTGRHVDIQVYPLTFMEFLHFNNLSITSKLDILSNRIIIRQMLRKYLVSGGFPQVVLSQEKNDILRGYFNDILLRDIAERYKIKKIDKLRSLAKYFLTNISTLTSFRKIANFIGISLDSVERFSYYLRDAYLIFFINRFSYSLKEQQVNPKKVYAIDQGLHNILGFKFSEDLGKLYENTVFLELHRKGDEIYYYKARHECDFIVKKGADIIQVIQVCCSLTQQNREREIAGLLEAINEFKLSEGTIITDDIETIEEHGDCSIRFIPLWKWLLSVDTPPVTH